MNKAELIQKLGEKYYRVATPYVKGTIENNITCYRATVFEKKDGAMIRNDDFYFYVENEGEANEIAYWSVIEPKPSELPIRFNDEVSDYIQAKIDAGAIEGAFVDNIDVSKEIAYGRAIINVTGNLVEKKIFIDKDVGGNIQHGVVG